MTPPPATPRADHVPFENSEAWARKMDDRDPLAHLRQRFHFPKDENGNNRLYFAGNSLGLQPVGVRGAIEQELNDWADLAVNAHFDGKTPWYSYHEVFRETGARLVGAIPGEVVIMNSLTVNLHLMMVTFYRPTPERFRIVMENSAFPSDTYAIKSQIRHHGFDPADALIILQPREGEQLLRTEDIVDVFRREGDSIAMSLMAGVNYFTGQVFDIAAITAAAHEKGCVAGWDLAHAAGNVKLDLHDWRVDFAAWCNYKYLNSGPGAVGGCFVHEEHGRNASLPRFAGWWGNDPATRFRMHLEPEFVPRTGADGWQISNPPIMAMAPVRESYAIFDSVGMDRLRAKSIVLTGYLRFLVDRLGPSRFKVITPSEQDESGCQLSICVNETVEELFHAINNAGAICDLRKPNVIRVAPTPLYNSFMDVYRFARILEEHTDESK